MGMVLDTARGEDQHPADTDLLHKGNLFDIIHIYGGWYHVNVAGTEGYISAQYVKMKYEQNKTGVLRIFSSTPVSY